jgi:hypothetical protein
MKTKKRLTKWYPDLSLRSTNSEDLGEESFGQEIDSLDVDSFQSSSDMGLRSAGLGLAPWLL